MNFYPNPDAPPLIFVRISQYLKLRVALYNYSYKEGMAVKTVDRTFLQGQSAELFRAAIKSQATRDPYERRLILFSQDDGCKFS